MGLEHGRRSPRGDKAEAAGARGSLMAQGDMQMQRSAGLGRVLCWAATVAGAMIGGAPARADQAIGEFHGLADAQNAGPPAETPAKGAGKANAEPAHTDPWGPVPTDKISLVNLAPGLVAYFNNGPVFGVPGTVTGSLSERTQLLGDWGGLRTEWARKGLFIDLYTTSSVQDVTSGGTKTGSSFVQNSQLVVNLDTGRAGLWDGGLIHFSLQSRYGGSPADTFNAGSIAPQYTGLVEPGPTFSSTTLPSEYFLVQALSKETALVVGKISDVFIPDQTLFADSYKYYFANFNFNKNPMTINFYHPIAWAALGVYAPTPWLAFAGGVLDPYSQADNFAQDAFQKGANFYAMALVSYDIGGLPGQFSPAFNWSNQPQLDLAAPYGAVTVSQIPQAIGALLGANGTEGLAANYIDNSWFAIANVSQFLYVRDDAATVRQKLKSGGVINGVGLIARAGYAPPQTNMITYNASIALFAHGLLAERPYDSFGVGFYYNGISDDLKKSVKMMTAGLTDVQDEKGLEVFYDFAITPAVHMIPGYQHIWNPVAAQVAAQQDHADLFTLRLTAAW